MNKISILPVTFLSALGGILLSSDVSSAGTMACLGHALPLSEGGCFISSGGAIMNICAATKRWEVSDTVGTAGNHTVALTAYMPNGGSLSCQACAVTKEGFNSNCTQAFVFNIVNTDTQFNIGVVNVPSYGGISVFCDMSQFAWYDSVSTFF